MRDDFGNVPEDAMVNLRMSKPLLRLLIQQTTGTTFRTDGGLNNLVGYHDDKELSDHALPVGLSTLLRTWRSYCDDTQEAVQVVSWLVARTAYLLLTPKNRPALKSLADLRPGAAVVGDERILTELAKTVVEDAATLDAATKKEEDLWKEAAEEANAAECAAEQLNLKSAAVAEVAVARQHAVKLRAAVSAASTAYGRARVAALNDVNMKLVARATATAPLPGARQALLTRPHTMGVDAVIGAKEGHLYGMLSKGQTEWFSEEQCKRGMWGDVLSRARDYEKKMKVRLVGLELLTTKPLSIDLEKAVAANDPGLFSSKSTRSGKRCSSLPVVVIHKGNMRLALGDVFGGIVARWQGMTPETAAEAVTGAVKEPRHEEDAGAAAAAVPDAPVPAAAVAAAALTPTSAVVAANRSHSRVAGRRRRTHRSGSRTRSSKRKVPT